MIHCVYGCLDTTKGLISSLSSHLKSLYHAVICVAKMRQTTKVKTVMVAFTTSRYLILMSCISHFSLPNPSHEPCSQSMNQLCCLQQPRSPPTLPFHPASPATPPPAAACQNICEILFSFNKV